MQKLRNWDGEIQRVAQTAAVGQANGTQVFG